LTPLMFQVVMIMAIERFRAKWTPVRVKKTRQNKKRERSRDLT
jgi:hypothetical protein